MTETEPARGRIDRRMNNSFSLIVGVGAATLLGAALGSLVLGDSPWVYGPGVILIPVSRTTQRAVLTVQDSEGDDGRDTVSMKAQQAVWRIAGGLGPLIDELGLRELRSWEPERFPSTDTPRAACLALDPVDRSIARRLPVSRYRSKDADAAVLAVLDLWGG